MQIDERLIGATRGRQTDARLRLQQRRDRLSRSGLDARVAAHGRRVDAVVGRALAALLARQHGRDRQLSSLSAQLDALSPLKTLGRGYAICWDAPGHEVVRSVTAVQPGQRVHVQLADGMLQCEVEGTAPDPSSRT
jgi:exodeoxyribonuclease VII large subunit